MSLIEEKLSEQFYEWELRGRGWLVFDQPVFPEPPFRPFHEHCLPPTPPLDDGRKPTALSSFIQRLGRKTNNKPTLPPVTAEAEQEPEPEWLVRDSLIELRTSLPENLSITREAFEQFLLNLSHCEEPIAFELLGNPQSVTAQFVAGAEDARHMQRQLEAHFPEAVFLRTEETLDKAWNSCEGDDALIVDFGLAREFMFTLAYSKLDPFIGIVGTLAELRADEFGLFQVIFQPTHSPWAESISRSVTDSEGKPFFVNAPELSKAAENKIARPLFAAVVRIAIASGSEERTLQIARDLASSLRVFSNPHGNELIPLSNDDYLFADHFDDVLRRQSRRSGMLLNSDELIGFVHLPGAAVRSPRLLRQIGKTRSAPKSVLAPTGISLGINEHAGRGAEIRLNPEQRVRHVHIIGASGTGKSTLLFNLIRQDIANGEGVAVLDPHGDLVDRVLGVIPPERINDMVLLDPTDEQYSIGFNILSAHSDFEKTLLASDLVSIFRRLSTSWGDQLNSVLNNAILAFLESSQGGTLADLRRFLLDAEFRNEFLKTVRDPDIAYYWLKAFPQLGGNKSIGPVLTRLDTFLSPKPIRYMVSQQANRLDFADILDSGKIFLVKLPQGQIGKENSFLLGSLLVSKFQQLAMSRQRMSQAERRDFWLYIDEFHYFITPSMTEILTGARKYRLGLILAHHELQQLQRDSEVASAVMSHPYTRIVFRVGDADAHALEKGFASFEARDLQNLEIGQAVCRVERSDFDFNLSVPLPEESDPVCAAEIRDRVLTASREKYATPRAEVEATLLRVAEVEPPPHESRPKPTRSAALVEPVPPLPVEDPRVEKAATVEPVAEVPKAALRPSDEGIGGAQHQATQRRIKEAAEKLGFLAVIEKAIPNGSVDLWLQRNGLAIACEISVTTTIDHEFRNVRKCLDVECAHVAVISSKAQRLQEIKAAVNAALGADKTSRAGYYTPDDFIAWLNTLEPVALTPISTGPTVTIRRGRKVTRKVPSLTPEELKTKEAERIALIAEVMRRRT